MASVAPRIRRMPSEPDSGDGSLLLDDRVPVRQPTVPPRHRWVSRHKTLTALIGLLVLGLVMVSGLAVWFSVLNHKLSQIERFEVDLGVDRPTAAAGARGTNFMLIGVDDGHEVDLEDMLTSGQWEPGIFRSDTIMVAHRSGDGSTFQVVSVPRDSYVDIPGRGLDKINAAFSYGGPDLLGRTVERLTGIRIDHVVVVDFQGFAGVTEAVGGVEVFLPDDIVDPRSGETTWHRGWERVEGERALQYVRTRYGLPRGDFDRVQRQQNMLRAIVDGVARTSVVANPFRLTGLVDEVTSHLAVDRDLDNAAVRSLAWSMRNLRPRDLDFATAPSSGTEMVGAASIVRLEIPELRRLFRAMDHDRFADYIEGREIDVLPGPEHVR
jgi:LCP family protein required for cell wall assembly